MASWLLLFDAPLRGYKKEPLLRLWSGAGLAMMRCPPPTRVYNTRKDVKGHRKDTTIRTQQNPANEAWK